MEICAILLLLSVSVLVLVCAFYILIRNERVCEFRIRINHICSERMKVSEWGEWEERMKMWNSIMDEPTYDDMLFSFKPLIPEAWFNDEELKFMGLK